MASSRILIMIILLFIFMINSLSQQTHWITSSGDSGPGTLRDAVANSGPGDVIRFLPNINSVLLQSNEIQVDKPLQIIGNDGLTTIRRNLSTSTPHFRIFNILYDSIEPDTLYLENLSIKNGYSPDGDIENRDGRNGGAILVSSPNLVLKLTNCDFYNNTCGNAYLVGILFEKTSTRAESGYGGSGGAIYSDAAMVITSCRFDGNMTGKGGDIYFDIIPYSMTAGAGGHGGAIYSNGYLLVNDCEFTDNQTHTGGNIEAGSRNFTTAYAGSAGSGGAIYALAGIGITQTIFENNKCGNGAKGTGNGWAQGFGGHGGSGAAVFCKNGSLDIAGSSFLGNLTGNGGTGTGPAGHGGGGGNGGAIFAEIATIEITDCSFQDNKSGDGNSGTGSQSGGGGSGGNGGCLFVKNCTLSCQNIIFQNNQTGKGGYGGSYYGSYSGWGGSGGAVYAENTSGSISHSDLIGNQTNIAGNAYLGDYYSSATANSGGSGGAMFLKSQSHMEFNSCRFQNNSTANGGHLTGPGDTTRHGGNGGSGGGISLTGSSSARVMNSLISRNTTGIGGVNNTDSSKTGNNGNGGGISISGGSTLTIINSTIAGNATGITDSAYSYYPQPGQGGGIYVPDTILTLINALIGINNINIHDSIFDNDLYGDYKLDHCLVLDTSGFMYSGNGNVFMKDPLYVDFPENLAVLPMSPAINNGKPDTTGMNLPVLDLNLNQRIFQRIDIGAYEFQVALNDSLEIIPAMIDFGDVLIGLAGYDSLQLINRGNSTLLIDSVQFSSDFSIRHGNEIWSSRIDSLIIYPGEEINYEIRFMPQAAVVYLDSALIFSNNLPFSQNIVLQGEGISPITVEVSSDCADKILAGQSYYCHVEINTFNGISFNYSIIEKPDWIYIYAITEDRIEISGRSNEQDTGQYSIHLIIDDSLTNVDFYQEIEVASPIPPSIQHNCILTTLAGQQYQCVVIATDFNSLPVNLTITDYPGWITWDKPGDDMVAISGIPGENDLGTAMLAFFASDSLVDNSYSFEITVGVDGISTPGNNGVLEDLFIHPNPAKDWITLILPDVKLPDELEISIYNLFGQVVLQKEVSHQNKTASLNISGLSPGFYLAACKDSRNRILKGKFEITR
jgi:hypothetical protein